MNIKKKKQRYFQSMWKKIVQQWISSHMFNCRWKWNPWSDIPHNGAKLWMSICSYFLHMMLLTSLHSYTVKKLKTSLPIPQFPFKNVWKLHLEICSISYSQQSYYEPIFITFQRIVAPQAFPRFWHFGILNPFWLKLERSYSTSLHSLSAKSKLSRYI